MPPSFVKQVFIVIAPANVFCILWQGLRGKVKQIEARLKLIVANENKREIGLLQ